MAASARADLPWGRDWMFSFCPSMISKSMRSSETDILGSSYDVVMVVVVVKVAVIVKGVYLLCQRCL